MDIMPTRINSYYGLYISLDEPQLRTIKEAMSANAAKAVEVAVRFNGEEREYTLSEFLARLGFAPAELAEGEQQLTTGKAAPCQHEIAERYVCVKCGGIVTATFE